MRYSLILLALLTSSVQAGIYKTYDKNGNVIFSDVPSNEAQEVEDKPVATVPALPRSVIDAKTKPLKDSKTATVPNSYKVTVAGLAPQTTLRKEGKALNAAIQLEPPLYKEHHLLVSLDGQSLGKDAFSPTIDPSKLERGQHRLEIKIIDKQQKTLQTEVVDFFIQQTTVNKPKTK
jgi:hypothetical protein